MKKIILSLSVIAAVAAIAIGGTIAYFSDTETSQGNTITAGTLNLKVNDKDGGDVGAVVTITDMKPSQVLETGWIKLHIYENPGKLYKHIITPTCNTGSADYYCSGLGKNVTNEPECEEEVRKGENNDTYKMTWFDLKVWYDENNNEKIDEDEERILIPDGKVTMKDLVSKWIYLGEYLGSKNVYVKQSFHLDKDVTNWAQGDVCGFAEDFMVLQKNAPHPASAIYVDEAGPNDPVCSDGIDNDFDGFIDAKDPGCQSLG